MEICIQTFRCPRRAKIKVPKANEILQYQTRLQCLCIPILCDTETSFEIVVFSIWSCVLQALHQHVGERCIGPSLLMVAVLHESLY